MTRTSNDKHDTCRSYPKQCKNCYSGYVSPWLWLLMCNLICYFGPSYTIKGACISYHSNGFLPGMPLHENSMPAQSDVQLRPYLPTTDQLQHMEWWKFSARINRWLLPLKEALFQRCLSANSALSFVKNLFAHMTFGYRQCFLSSVMWPVQDKRAKRPPPSGWRDLVFTHM